MAVLDGIYYSSASFMYETLWVAFVGGIISFLAPCILPIVPGFLAYLAGSQLNSQTGRRDIFINTIFFVLGFSLIFATLGIALNSLLANVATDVQLWLSRVGGLFIIFFGLYLAGLLRVSWLERQYKLPVNVKLHSRYVMSLLFGAAFAVGWTPCVGAVLGAILVLAATEPNRAFLLLLAYALGLGVPFLIVGFFAAQASTFINKYLKFFNYINHLFGVVLIIMGILVFTENLSLVANWSFLNTILLK